MAAALGLAPGLNARAGGWQRAASASPAALAADDGEPVYVGRDPVRIKVSPNGAGRLAMITQDVSAGTSIPVHLHEREDARRMSHPAWPPRPNARLGISASASAIDDCSHIANPYETVIS